MQIRSRDERTVDERGAQDLHQVDHLGSNRQIFDAGDGCGFDSRKIHSTGLAGAYIPDGDTARNCIGFDSRHRLPFYQWRM